MFVQDIYIHIKIHTALWIFICFVYIRRFRIYSTKWGSGKCRKTEAEEEEEGGEREGEGVKGRGREGRKKRKRIT